VRSFSTCILEGSFMADVLIREIRFDELDACAAVIRQSFATVAKEFGLTEQNCPSNGAFIKTERLAEMWLNGTKAYGLFAANELVGVMQLWEAASAEFELNKVAVLPSHRHAGYGAQLLEYARRIVREKGGSKITIGIIEDNKVLRDWYLKHGFLHTGTKVYPHLPFTVGFMEMEV
jgi:ribosomal protein S18 acetylase RimI-like enzyme